MARGNNKADPAASGELNIGTMWFCKLECTGHIPLLKGSQTARNGLSFGLQFSSWKKVSLEA